MKTNRFLSLAAFFAIAFTFSCSSDDPSPPPSVEPSSDSSGANQQVFCKLNAGTCSQVSLSTCMELVNAGVAQIVPNCNVEPPPPSSSSVAPPPPPPPSSSSIAPPPSPPPSSSSVAPPPPSSSGTSGTFTDTRDSKTYKWVKIGLQTWMAQNLNYNASGSKCYNNSEANCTKYGRLYNWTTAKSACPSGWHLSNDVEWMALELCLGALNCSSKNATELKAKNGWDDFGNGTDDYGFSALPGGFIGMDGSFNGVGFSGNWWTSDQYGNNSDSNSAYGRTIFGDDEKIYMTSDNKGMLQSVRCVKD